MKKIAFIMVSLLAAAACNDMITLENTPAAGEEGITYFVSTMEGNDVEVEEDDTKTTLQPSNSYRVFWEDTDYISIYDGSAAHQYKATPYLDVNGNKTTAHFYPVQTGLVLPAGQKYYALYPYDENAEWNGSKVTFTIPETQTAVAGNFAYNASVAVSDKDNNLKFCNVGALIGFSLNTSGVKTILFETVGGEPLTGKVTVDCSDPDNQESLTVVEGSSSLMLDGTGSAQTSFYVTVLPGTYSRGIKVTLFSDKGYQSTVTPSFTLNRKERVALGMFSVSTNNSQGFQGAYQGYNQTYEGVNIKVTDESAPGGFYYPLACGIDVAGTELHYNSSKNKSWNSFCDPKNTLTTDTAKNLSLADVPANPCPQGWNLPTKSQLDRLVSTENYIQYRHAQACYWKMRSGDLCDHRDLWGHTNMYIISSETNNSGNCYRWGFTYTGYKENNVILYYHLTANGVSSQARDKADNAYASFRCVRESQQ